MKSITSWSGGKDSCFALMKAIVQQYTPAVLLNVLNEEGQISRSHGIPSNILERQAALARIPLHCISSSWNDYEQKFTSALSTLRATYQVTHAVFGDIDLQAHRDWEEKVCAAAGLTALLPLWQQDRKTLLIEMLDAGIQTMIVSCNETMGPSFIGRIMNQELMKELEVLGVDVCGENGEFHTLVLDCPLFSSRLDVVVEEKLPHDRYWFGRLRLA
jgi:diphthine-ammonia ligase